MISNIENDDQNDFVLRLSHFTAKIGDLLMGDIDKSGYAVPPRVLMVFQAEGAKGRRVGVDGSGVSAHASVVRVRPQHQLSCPYMRPGL